ncbi:hypothetical protein TAMYLO_730124 [Tenacibaculum amylolyticum]
MQHFYKVLYHSVNAVKIVHFVPVVDSIHVYYEGLFKKKDSLLLKKEFMNLSSFRINSKLILFIKFLVKR